MKTTTLQSLKALVEKDGMAAVLANLSRLLRDEADEVRECEGEGDEQTADTIDGIASRVLEAAAAYDEIPVG